MDGKQARRTKTSSALGELFDHGVDSWACFLFPVCIFSVLSTDRYGFSPMAMHLLLWTIYLSFIDSHWEKYNTKVLYLPWSYDISMLVGDRSDRSQHAKSAHIDLSLGDDHYLFISLFLHTSHLPFRRPIAPCAVHTHCGIRLAAYVLQCIVDF